MHVGVGGFGRWLLLIGKGTSYFDGNPQVDGEGANISLQQMSSDQNPCYIHPYNIKKNLFIDR